jgi:hypothetical protein
MNSRYNHHIHGWLEKIESNIEKFRKNYPNPSNAERLEFISHQYHLVMLINRALQGTVIFVGAKPIDPVIIPVAKKKKKKKTSTRKIKNVK